MILYHKAKLSKLITPLLIFTIQHQTRKTFKMYYYFTFRNDKLLMCYFTFCNLNFKWRKVISSFCCHISPEYFILCISSRWGDIKITWMAFLNISKILNTLFPYSYSFYWGTLSQLIIIMYKNLSQPWGVIWQKKRMRSIEAMAPCFFSHLSQLSPKVAIEPSQIPCGRWAID